MNSGSTVSFGKIVLSVIAGIATFLIATWLISWLCYFILQIPLLVSILSYPSSPDLYVSIVVNLVPCGLAIGTSLAISPRTKRGFSYGGIITGVAVICLGAVSLFFSILSNGLFYEVNVGYLLSTIIGFYGFSRSDLQ